MTEGHAAIGAKSGARAVAENVAVWINTMNANGHHKDVTQREYEKRIARLCLFIDTYCITTDEMSISNLAGQCGWTVFHFHRVFRAIVGEPAGHYVRRKRLEYAANLLVRSCERIDDIAERMGYESACAFARAFKKMFGISPGAFRQLQRSMLSDAMPTQFTGATLKRSKNGH